MRFGACGYQDIATGLYLHFSGPAWGVVAEIPAYPNAGEKGAADMVRDVVKLLRDAKVRSIEELRGKPVEVVFAGNVLKSWRVLTEAL